MLWKKLVDYYAPATRQRALSLSQAISSFPQFVPGGDKTLQEHVSGMETLVQQYDSLSSKAFDRDVLLGVLLRLCPDNIRQHLTLAISDSSSYQEVKERIFAYERSSRMWNVNDVFETVGKQVSSSSKGESGPVPMEVDAVTKGKGYEKGKGKQKGKQKIAERQLVQSVALCWLERWWKIKRQEQRKEQVERKVQRQIQRRWKEREIERKRSESGSVPDLQWLGALGK